MRDEQECLHNIITSLSALQWHWAYASDSESEVLTEALSKHIAGASIEINVYQ